jgi:PAS domain S-box-containing protein
MTNDFSRKKDPNVLLFIHKMLILSNFTAYELVQSITLTMMTNPILLLESLSEAILVLDTNGTIRYANPAASRITGYAQEQLLNKPVYQFYGGEEESIKINYELEQALKRGQFTSEGWRLKANGERFWGEATLTPLRDEGGTLIGFTCLLHDTTDKKMDELELRNNHDHFRLMVESVQDYSIFMLDATGHILTWNEGARRTQGYRPDEIIGKHFSTFYTPQDLEAEKPAMELRVATQTGKYEEEGWRVRKNGSLFWASVTITALFDQQGTLVGFSKVTRDLTERKEAEEALRQSEERYRSLVQQVNDYGIFMLDDKGHIISWNEGAHRIKGYTAQEIIGKHFSVFYPEEDIINGKPSYELKVARAEGKYEEEGWRLRKDGTRFWANVVITAIYNSEGILIGFSKVTRDLTERKEAERALRDAYERTRHLAEELKAANSELSYANRELEQFTSIASHDLQEPLRTIKSFLQLMEMKISQGQYEGLQTYIAKSISAANRMRELIQNLLQYTQLDKAQVVQEPVSVDELINQALQNLRNSVDTSGAQITVETGVDTVCGDRVQLLQLMQNLLSNALKFTDTEAPRVNIRSEAENGHVKFAVSDNGIGIQQADLHKVFQIFRRLNTRKDYPGTGIGLAICKKIVDRHHGRIWPESEPGKGTTFYFTLHEVPSEKTLSNEEV